MLVFNLEGRNLISFLRIANKNPVNAATTNVTSQMTWNAILRTLYDRSERLTGIFTYGANPDNASSYKGSDKA